MRRHSNRRVKSHRDKHCDLYPETEQASYMGIISHFPSFVNSFFEKSQKKLFSDRCKTVKKAQIHVCPEPKIHFFRKSLIFFEKRLDKRLNLWYNITVPKRRFLCKGRRWCGSMAEQLICNQQVVGSTPITSSIWGNSRVAKGGRL